MCGIDYRANWDRTVLAMEKKRDTEFEEKEDKKTSRTPTMV